ncbi:hypothetical protein AXW83_25600 [Bosea sp. PAMC 26642]|nr:hypothetical protein AXW83_25600 [Bosea sp. PAMC 26642]
MACKFIDRLRFQARLPEHAVDTIVVLLGGNREVAMRDGQGNKLSSDEVDKIRSPQAAVSDMSVKLTSIRVPRRPSLSARKMPSGSSRRIQSLYSRRACQHARRPKSLSRQARRFQLQSCGTHPFAQLYWNSHQWRAVL